MAKMNKKRFYMRYYTKHYEKTICRLFPQDIGNRRLFYLQKIFYEIFEKRGDFGSISF